MLWQKGYKSPFTSVTASDRREEGLLIIHLGELPLVWIQKVLANQSWYQMILKTKECCKNYGSMSGIAFIDIYFYQQEWWDTPAPPLSYKKKISIITKRSDSPHFWDFWQFYLCVKFAFWKYVENVKKFTHWLFKQRNMSQDLSCPQNHHIC